MRDDDDDILDDDEPKGRLYRSGIQRESEVEPADYALTPGMAALEGESSMPEIPNMSETDDHDEDSAPHSRGIDRRRAMMMILGGISVGSTAFWFGRASSEEPTPLAPTHRGLGTRLQQEDLELIEAARAWADGPLESLLAGSPTFLWVFEVIEPDPTLIRGLNRLCEYAVLAKGETGCELATAILSTFERVPAPLDFERHRDGLRRVVVDWQTRGDRKQ